VVRLLARFSRCRARLHSISPLRRELAGLSGYNSEVNIFNTLAAPFGGASGFSMAKCALVLGEPAYSAEERCVRGSERRDRVPV